MLSINHNTLSIPYRRNPKPTTAGSCQCQFSQGKGVVDDTNCKANYETERNLRFNAGDTFFRRESATGRDLAVLAASIYKKCKGRLRVIDAMCGCGIRSLRYLVEAEADFVLANDANEEIRKVIMENLSQVERSFEDERRWVVTHSDANRVMSECYLQKDLYDLIDIDSFGSNSSFMRSAYDSLKVDGLLYLTCTDGFTSGGRRPQHSLAAYGAYVRPMPFSNEIGLRMLIGGAVREASVLRYHVTPLFSYYSYHGPVFRVMLRVHHGKLPDMRHYGFISYCTHCGNSQAFSWEELGQISCPCSSPNVSESLIVSGPLWIGPLHNAAYVTEMLNLAEQRGWVSNSTGADMEKLLKQFVDESDPNLPFGYIMLDEVASRAKVNLPPLKKLMSTILKEGYAVCRSHIELNAIKTNCPMTTCIRIARELQNC